MVQITMSIARVRHAEKLIAALSHQLDTPLSLEENICALFDADDHEMAIIEFDMNSDLIAVHRRILASSDVEDKTCREMLRLNADQTRLSGCWLALDTQNALRLMSTETLSLLNESRFCNHVIGFMDVADEVTALPMVTGARHV